MIQRDSVMVVLSPRLLLEINLSVTSPEDLWLVREGISSSKFREFRRRAIANSYKEIIFHDKEALNDWRSTPEYKIRVRTLRNPVSSSSAVREGAMRVLWMINGMGRVPDDFENVIRPYFEV
jgi:hypothetical protein